MTGRVLPSLAVALSAALAVAMVLACCAGTAFAQTPPNDDWASATVIPGIPFTDSIDTTEATTEDTDPDCAGNGPTVWYSFTPAFSGTVTVLADTFGSDYDTTLSVYTGSPGSFTQLGCNDDAFSPQSRVIFDATAGVTYSLMVGSFASGPGGSLTFHLDVAPPPLDIEVEVDPVGTFDPGTGTATVHGTVVCSQPANVSISGTIEQRVGRFLVRGFLDAFVLCDGETDWSAVAIPESGLLKGGHAHLLVGAFGDDGVTFDADFHEQTIQLKGGGGN